MYAELMRRFIKSLRSSLMKKSAGGGNMGEGHRE